MSMTPGGRHECDCCGTDLGNGGLPVALIVSDLDPDTPGMVRNLHYCRDRDEGEGRARRRIKGCARKLIHPATMRAHDKRKKEASGG